MAMGSATAGQGHPYWYEWFVGLVEVVELLDPASGIESVSFQVSGIQGWDDVVVRHVDGSKRYYQVKHTRSDDNLTFGDLVQVVDGRSLLQTLFTGWKTTGLNDGRSRYILYTNRDAGNRWSETTAGVRRPPLLEFMVWLAAALEDVESIDDVVPDSDWVQCWDEWCLQLAAENDVERLAFLRSLEIRTTQDDRDGLENRILNKLQQLFGVGLERVKPFFNTLTSELRRWTTGHEKVTAEELCSVLALAPEPLLLAPAPPPPSPFFPSRIPFAETLESELTSSDCEPVFFLTAEPGGGKTSLLSWLANRRPDRPFETIVGLRFFCFEPIRPDSPFIAPDTSRVRPNDLWMSLLTQLREGLRGRLRELDVPLRNDLVTWQEARQHVLRLASLLGAERGNRFVIVVDGIDHAARAAQTSPQQAKEFFESLPGPDELMNASIRLLVAGQPAEFYGDHYPAWLQGHHESVKTIHLPGLQDDDVRRLYASSNTGLPADHADQAVRMISDLANGNTLSTVFAVAEAEHTSSLDALQSRLQERRLADGLEQYYTSIWNHTLLIAADYAHGVDACVVGTLSLAVRGLSPELFATAFREWRRPRAWWQTLLESMGPLLTEGSDGFRVRHNDVRVFLAARFSGFNANQRGRVFSNLAAYYRDPQADRTIAHLQLCDLLRLAGEHGEVARIFNVDWVLEAGALGIATPQLWEECKDAIRGLLYLREWPSVVSVACAAQTLVRLDECSDEFDFQTPDIRKPLPPFLPSEATVRPLTQWKTSDLSALASDATTLVDHQETARAHTLLQRWLGGLDLIALVQHLTDIDEAGPVPEHDDGLSHDASWAYEQLGWLCGTLPWQFPIGESAHQATPDPLFAFERGFVRAVLGSALQEPLAKCFDTDTPKFTATWQKFVSGCAQQGKWELVCESMRKLSEIRGKLDPLWLAEATRWALYSGAASENSTWLDPLSKPSFGVESTSQDTFGVLLSVSRAIGWTRLDLSAGDIADSVYRVFDPAGQIRNRRAPTELAFQASAMLGRIDAAHRQGGADAARGLVSPKSIRQLLDALWGDVILKAAMFEHRLTTAGLAKELAIAGLEMGGDFATEAKEAAMNAARAYPVHFNFEGLWIVIAKCGERELLQKWVHRWLDDESDLWQMSRADIHSIVGQIIPFAKGISELQLADAAQSRLKSFLVGYRGHKEYSFESALDWFRDLSRRSPSQSELPGWKLWCLCDACDSQDGDNRLEWDLREGIAAAAMHCGANSWWRLVSSTLDRRTTENWPDNVRQWLVNAAAIAITNGGRFQSDEVDAIWSLSIALSRWSKNVDNGALQELREHIRSFPVSEAARLSFERTLSRTSRSKSLDAQMADSEPSTGAITEVTANQTSDKLYGDASVKDEWQPIESLAKELDDPESFIFYGVFSKLLGPALAHAANQGPDSVLFGLNQQLEMHHKWTYGACASPQDDWQRLPDAEQITTWPDIAVRLIGLLLDSYSVEVLMAAIEGLHSLVNSAPDQLPKIFSELKSHWQRHWFLIAAESWAVHYPSAFAQVRPIIEQMIPDGNLAERLQAWIVLCKHSDATNQPRPLFTTGRTMSDSSVDCDKTSTDAGLMFVPPTQVGHVSFIDRHAAANSILRNLNACGWDFRALDSEIQSRLARTYVRARDIKRDSIRCRGDTLCTRADADEAVGDAILSDLSGETVPPEGVPLLAQGFLGNDEASMQFSAPQSSTTSLWPEDDSYAPKSEITAFDLTSQLREIALSLDVEKGWRTFAARVYFCTSTRDHLLWLWWEHVLNDLLIRPSCRPTCPSGRSFVWWLGDCFEPETDGGRVVSAYFVGGHQRLHYCHFEIQPSQAWRDLMGWEIDESNPLVWRYGDQVVARYERLHGPLRDTLHGPHFRQPLVDRWLVTDSAFDQFQFAVGALRMRDEFEQFNFKDD